MRSVLAAAIIVITLFCAQIVLGLSLWFWALCAVTVLIVLAYVFRVRFLHGVRAKLAEWSSDLKQLGLWLRLAFTRDRDVHATAAMAHQQQFLQGRIMSPMNLFAIAAIATIGSVGAVGIEEWRIGRIKKERDAPCSQGELSLNDAGRYRTSRASCSALGATLSVAVQWRDRATAIAERRETEIAAERAENARTIELETARRARATASANRQRRRQNEAVTAALGGPPPDLERSVCELAGGVGCDAASAVDAGEPPAAADLPAPAGSAGGDATPVTP